MSECKFEAMTGRDCCAEIDMLREALQACAPSWLPEGVRHKRRNALNPNRPEETTFDAEKLVSENIERAKRGRALSLCEIIPGTVNCCCTKCRPVKTASQETKCPAKE